MTGTTAVGVTAAEARPGDTAGRSRLDVGLSRMTVGLPGRMELVEDILVRNGRGAAERRMFRRFYGLRDSPTLAPGQRMVELLAEVARTALGDTTPALILYGHTLLGQEFAYRGGFADWLRAELGTPGVPMYGVSHINCTSVLRCVELARAFLASRPGQAVGPVLVIGGDHGSITDCSRFVPGMTVGGDAALAFTVTADLSTADLSTAGTSTAGTGGSRPAGARYRYLAGASARDTQFYQNLRMSPDEALLYGRACREMAADTVRRAAQAAGLTLADLDWLMPHLSNAMFWRGFSDYAGIPRDRICLTLLPEQGHNFGTDALMALDRADRDGLLQPGQRCALVSIGQGAYVQVIIVEIAEEQ